MTSEQRHMTKNSIQQTDQQLNNDEYNDLFGESLKSDQQIRIREQFNVDNNDNDKNKMKKIFALVLSLLVIIYAYSVLGQSSNNLNSQTNIKTLSITVNKDGIKNSVQKGQSSERKNSNSVKNKKDDDDQEFSLNFVQTTFQGKQTEQKLSQAANNKLQNQKLGIVTNQNDQQRKTLLQDLSMLESMIPDKAVPGYKSHDFYFFSVSINQMILNSELDKLYRKGQTIFKITLKQHIRSIIRTQLVHNVNFKGQIEVKLSPFDKSLEEKQRAIEQIITDEQIYYESFYEISQYKKYQLRFCLLVPSYNNVKYKLYLRNLDSIFMQDYDNYHVVYIDDASKDSTGQMVKKYIKEKGIPQEKIQVFINDVNKKAMYNIYNYIHDYCPDGEIVGLIDGDDSLLGRKVLQLYNAVYQKKKSAIVYSNFLKILTNNKTSFGFGTQVTKSYYFQGRLRNDFSLVGTHFMTFFSDLFKKIKKEDLCFENGTFYDYAYDRAIITPMIQMAFPRVEYLTQITYEYRNDTGINDGSSDWQRVSKIILAKPAYQFLGQYPFIDDFIKRKEKLIEKQKNSVLKSFGINVDSHSQKFVTLDDQEEAQNIQQKVLQNKKKENKKQK